MLWEIERVRNIKLMESPRDCGSSVYTSRMLVNYEFRNIDRS